MKTVAPVSLCDLLSASPQQRNVALATQRKRTDALEDTLQVFAHRRDDAPSNDGPLSGIAVGVKDIFDTHDMPTCHGSPIYDNHRPPADSALVARLRRCGATIAGKTVTTEFAWMTPNVTRNPHDTGHTPGGSSSGSAAGVAAGFFPVAIGSQTGGSVIRPASFCGVAGYKPSFRLFPTVGMKHFSWSLDTPGFFAKTVADCAAFAAILSDRPLQVAHEPRLLRIGLYRSTIDDHMSADMAQALQICAEACRAAGATVVDVDSIASVEAAHAAHAPIQDFEAAQALADEAMRHADVLSPQLRAYLDTAKKVSPETYDTARRTAKRARKASRDLFAQCDVLLVASAPGAAPETLESTGDSRFNRLWTLLGLPCVNVSGLRGENGLPLGLQVVAPFGQDALALQAAHWIEKQGIDA